MKKGTKPLLWIVGVIAAIAGFLWWQFYELGEGLRTMRIGK